VMVDKFVEKLDQRGDISSVVTTCTAFADVGNYTFEYDLPMTIRDLQAQIVDPNKKMKLGIGKFLSVNLAQIMEGQKKDFPQLKLPILFLNARAVIITNKGYASEGIFRLSPSHKQLETLVEQFKEGDYTIKTDDVNLAAGIMKAWMRELEIPLIPPEFYAECIRLNKSEPEQMIDEFDKLQEMIPVANRAMIHAITDMVKSISTSPNV